MLSHQRGGESLRLSPTALPGPSPGSGRRVCHLGVGLPEAGIPGAIRQCDVPGCHLGTQVPGHVGCWLWSAELLVGACPAHCPDLFGQHCLSTPLLVQPPVCPWHLKGRRREKTSLLFLPAQHEVGSLPLCWLGFFTFKRSGLTQLCVVIFGLGFMIASMSLIILRGVVKFSKWD